VATSRGLTALFTIGRTRIRVHPVVLMNLVGLWAGMSWLAGRGRPQRGWPRRIALGGLYAAMLMLTDFGHALAHTISARLASAPMDELHISAGMPRTIYYDNDVTPATHKRRSLGGPVFNVVGLATSLLLYRVASKNTVVRECGGWSSLGHGFLLVGSLAPLPFVDGGVILKWTLVERGRTPAEADAAIRRIDLVLGGIGLLGGSVLAVRRLWWAAAGLIGAGIIAIGAALDKIE
jgi:hypothetical protein